MIFREKIQDPDWNASGSEITKFSGPGRDFNRVLISQTLCLCSMQHVIIVFKHQRDLQFLPENQRLKNKMVDDAHRCTDLRKTRGCVWPPLIFHGWARSGAASCTWATNSIRKKIGSKQCWGSGSASQRYGSGSFPFLIKVLSGLK